MSPRRGSPPVGHNAFPSWLPPALLWWAGMRSRAHGSMEVSRGICRVRGDVAGSTRGCAGRSRPFAGWGARSAAPLLFAHCCLRRTFRRMSKMMYTCSGGSDGGVVVELSRAFDSAHRTSRFCAGGRENVARELPFFVRDGGAGEAVGCTMEHCDMDGSIAAERSWQFREPSGHIEV